MIEINLAPGQSKRTSAARFQLPKLPNMPEFAGDPIAVIGGGILVLVILILGFLTLRTGARASDLRIQIERQVTDSTRFAATIDLVSEVTARQDTIEQKIDVIQSVDQRRYIWPHLLDEISTALPQYTWLEQITSTRADSAAVGPRFTLQGNAGSTQALTRFMKNLEASPFIRQVTLITSEQGEVEGRRIHFFTLEAAYEEPPRAILTTVPLLGTEVRP